MQKKKILIIEAGEPSPKVRKKHGKFPELIKKLLKESDFEFEIVHIDGLKKGFYFSTYDGIIITGSSRNVYDMGKKHQWLFDAIKHEITSSKPVMGICFGHQLMARAMGGKVEKRRWEVGIRRYWVDEKFKDMFGLKKLRFSSSHQAQVTQMPESAVVLASSKGCPNAVLGYPNEGGKITAISFQAHPEMHTPSIRTSLKGRRKKLGKKFVERELKRIDEMKKKKRKEIRATRRTIVDLITKCFKGDLRCG